MIENPILKGFNPDPSICRVGDDYYIATSTFEWFPGVQIHHSKDLKHWEVIAHPLNRLSQLEMKGVPDSCGVWAPCLSYSKGTFFLVYTNVKSFDGVWKDTPNYVVTTNDINGEWSDPIYLNSAGFDGSIFHDDDEKIWYTCMVVDHRKGKFFGGIELREFDLEEQQLVGETYYLTEGTELGCTEGPHLYKRNGYYYLMLAEGGTEYGHAETMMRSKNLTGPYELHPNNPFLTCADHPNHGLQKSGHASLIETQTGDWYITFLVGRPLTTQGNCPLGRETAIEEIEWIDGWPYLKSGTSLPRMVIPESKLELNPFPERSIRDDFNSDKLSLEFQSLRIPHSDWASLTERPGFLRLKGRESLTSIHTQAMIARRVQHFNAEISTCLEFHPERFQHMAGLVLYYNIGHYHYMYITKNGDDRELCVMTCDHYGITEQEERVKLNGSPKVVLKATINYENLQFSYSFDDENFYEIGEVLDMNIVSDDHVREGSYHYRPAFTGCFVGMCCQDLFENKLHADFDWFEYLSLD